MREVTQKRFFLSKYCLAVKVAVGKIGLIFPVSHIYKKRKCDFPVKSHEIQGYNVTQRGFSSHRHTIYEIKKKSSL